MGEDLFECELGINHEEVCVTCLFYVEEIFRNENLSGLVSF